MQQLFCGITIWNEIHCFGSSGSGTIMPVTHFISLHVILRGLTQIIKGRLCTSGTDKYFWNKGNQWKLHQLPCVLEKACFILIWSNIRIFRVLNYTSINHYLISPEQYFPTWGFTKGKESRKAMMKETKKHINLVSAKAGICTIHPQYILWHFISIFL